MSTSNVSSPGGATPRAVDWNSEVIDQVDGHWIHQLRPRLDGLSDDEYFWEPVPGCWSVRPVSDPPGAATVGAGAFRLDYVRRPASPAPVTTIAWRLAHLIASVIGTRVAGQFDGPPVSVEIFAYAGSAGEALAQLDDAYGRWIAGVRALGEEGLARPMGPSEAVVGNDPTEPVAGLVLHISREIIHHGAEICLLRDLYRAGNGSVIVQSGQQ